MDFALTSEQEMLRDSVREFVSRYCPKDKVREWDDARHWPEELYLKMAEYGYLGVAVDPEYGGTGGDIINQALTFWELARGIQGSSLFFYMSSCFGGKSVGLYGTEEQKKFFLPALCEGKLRFGISITEPGGGTDVLGHMKTTARKDGSDWVVNGVKVFTTGANLADYLLLVTRSKPVQECSKKSDGITIFLCPKDSPGLTMRPIPTIALRTCDSFEVVYDNVRIPNWLVLGQPHEGWKLLLHTLNNERIMVAAFCIGCAEAALEDAIAHAKLREAFGKPIGAFQGIAHSIANMAVAVEHARLITMKAAWLQSQGLPCGMEATMAKLVASEAADLCGDVGMQVLGGMGIAKEADMQRYWRDARPMLTGPVSNQMSRNFIAMHLGLPRPY